MSKPKISAASEMDNYEDRVDLAAAFRWTARLNMHEGVANHFSLSVNEDSTKFLMNPNQKHFSRIKASDLLLLDANEESTLDREDAPDPTAWGVHGSIHRNAPQAKCVLHVHSIFATVLASLADSNLPPIDQNTATFYERYVVDENFGGLAFREEGERCAAMLSDPKVKTMIMGNHGFLVIGDTVSEAFNRMYYFERACETYVRALQTGQPLRVLSHEIASKTAQQLEDYPEQDLRHFEQIKLILDDEEPTYRS